MRERFKKKIRSRGSDVKIDFQFSWGSINLNSFENELTVFTKKSKKKKKEKREKKGKIEVKRGKKKKKKERKTFCLNPHVRKVNFK